VNHLLSWAIHTIATSPRCGSCIRSPRDAAKPCGVGNAEDVAGSPWKTYNIFLVSMDALFYWIWIPLNGMGYLHGSLIWISKRLLNGIIGAFEFFGMDLHGIGIPCSWAVKFPIILN